MSNAPKLPGIPIDRITPDVEPIEGEAGRYWVHSRSGESKYLVDLFENGFVGKCNCPHFEFRIQPDIDRGIKVNGNQFCYHIKRAERESFVDEPVDDIEAQRQLPPRDHPAVFRAEITLDLRL